MKLSSVRLISPQTDKIERLENIIQEQTNTILFLNETFKSFVDMCTGMKQFCYCKDCQLFNDLPDSVCLYYDENKPRPMSLCILFSLMVRINYSHTCDDKLYEQISRTLEETSKAFNNFATVEIDQMITKYAPQLKKRLEAMDNVDAIMSVDNTNVLGDFDGDV